MVRTVSATEAKNNLGSLLRIVGKGGETVIVENRRKPTAVIVSYGQFEECLRLKDEQRRRDALVQFRELSAELAERNQDLTDEQVEELAQRAIADIRQERKAMAGIRSD